MLKFELNIADRKTLANRMEELTGIHPYYTRAPLYAYDIGNYTIDRDGNLLVESENADAELLTTLLNEGLIRGGESIESTDDRPEDTELTADTDEEPVTEADTEQGRCGPCCSIAPVGRTITVLLLSGRAATSVQLRKGRKRAAGM